MSKNNTKLINKGQSVILLFFSHKFLTRNARKPSKGSKDSDFSLVSNKNLNQKFPLAVGTQGQVTWARMT